MKLYCFTIPAKGEICAEIKAESVEDAREILKTGDWDMLDDYCFDPEIHRAQLTCIFDILQD